MLCFIYAAGPALVAGDVLAVDLFVDAAVPGQDHVHHVDLAATLVEFHRVVLPAVQPAFARVMIRAPHQKRSLAQRVVTRALLVVLQVSTAMVILAVVRLFVMVAIGEEVHQTADCTINRDQIHYLFCA